jgi:hypothetical protein
MRAGTFEGETSKLMEYPPYWSRSAAILRFALNSWFLTASGIVAEPRRQKPAETVRTDATSRAYVSRVCIAKDISVTKPDRMRDALPRGRCRRLARKSASPRAE